MKNEISSHLVTSRENLAPNYFAEFPVLALIKLNIHDVMMQLRKPHAHLTSICFSAWIRNIANFVEIFVIFSRFRDVVQIFIENREIL